MSLTQKQADELVNVHLREHSACPHCLGRDVETCEWPGHLWIDGVRSRGDRETMEVDILHANQCSAKRCLDSECSCGAIETRRKLEGLAALLPTTPGPEAMS